MVEEVHVTRVAVLDDYQSVAASMADWDSLGVEVTFFHDHLADQDDVVERLVPFSVIVAMRERTPFPESLFERLPHLQLLVTTGMKNASIDLAAAQRAGVMVCGTEGIHVGVVELTWGLILAAARNLHREDALIRAGGWQGSIGPLLSGKTLGLVGLGRLGTPVAQIGHAFGMKCIAWSPHLTSERTDPHGVARVSKTELFETSDVVTVHLGLGPTTRGTVGEAELRSMKRSAIVVNTSRGPIIDEPALLEAVTEGWIAGAALDVFGCEPLEQDSPWRSAPRTLLTPHLGYVSTDNYRVVYGQAAEDVRQFLEDSPMRRLQPTT